MYGLCLPTDAGNDIRVQETLNDIVRTYEYDDVFVTEPAVKYEHICSNVNTGMGEVVLVGMEFPDSMRMLNDPNIWILNTAASVHTSPYQHGMTPESKTVNSGSITIGNGIAEKTAMYGHISGIVCNKQGSKAGRVKLILVVSY
jgi:hypothetical protein